MFNKKFITVTYPLLHKNCYSKEKNPLANTGKYGWEKVSAIEMMCKKCHKQNTETVQIIDPILARVASYNIS